MDTPAPRGWWQRFRALPRTSVTKTLGLAFLMAFVSALLVTSTRVLLQPMEQAHIDAERAEKLLASLRSVAGMGELFAEIEATDLQLRLVDLESGEFAVEANTDDFDERAAAADPSTSIALPREIDEAGIGRRAKRAAVYAIGDLERPNLVVLPVYGLGYQSTIRAFVVLKGDLTTIAAFTVYEHGETPGMGSRIAEPEWSAQFRGKQVFTADGAYALRITARGANGVHQVDGIAGATRSTSGISKMLRFWLGPHGYGPLLKRLKNNQAD